VRVYGCGGQRRLPSATVPFSMLRAFVGLSVGISGAARQAAFPWKATCPRGACALHLVLPLRVSLPPCAILRFCTGCIRMCLRLLVGREQLLAWRGRCCGVLNLTRHAGRGGAAPVRASGWLASAWRGATLRRWRVPCYLAGFPRAFAVPGTIRLCCGICSPDGCKTVAAGTPSRLPQGVVSGSLSCHLYLLPPARWRGVLVYKIAPSLQRFSPACTAALPLPALPVSLRLCSYAPVFFAAAPLRFLRTAFSVTYPAHATTSHAGVPPRAAAAAAPSRAAAALLLHAWQGTGVRGRHLCLRARPPAHFGAAPHYVSGFPLLLPPPLPSPPTCSWPGVLLFSTARATAGAKDGGSLSACPSSLFPLGMASPAA